ncbi:MAG: hypothetical protein J7449_03715 [Thermomicrobium sp.]|jgi:hypothetical protein|uniref:anti-sigma factor family protein n=1 Tax=Thermomicrobium sp. TaxID=1969469 RepID=UPI001B2B63E9|nr:hypothetical protein [Thermomicrobium sp.]MBO9350566.1 hypothetical protein [Thermomicrobium sp.]
MTDRSSHLDEERLALLASEEPDAEVSAHLAQCEFCRRRWQEYRAVRQALRSLPAPPLPRDFAAGFEDIEFLPRDPWWWRYRTALRAGTLLAATLLVVLLSTLLVRPLIPPREEPSAAPASSPADQVAVLAEPSMREPGAGGPFLPSPEALAGTPVVPSDTNAKLPPEPGSPAPLPAAGAAEAESSSPLPIASPLGWLALAVLALLVLAGFLLGFLLPAISRRR